MTPESPEPDRPDEARLLPWRRSDGGPCYVVGEGTGRVSRLADSIEAIQLGMAEELLERADDMITDRRVTFAQVLFLATRLTEALRDVCRIAEGRGARLAVAHGPEASPGRGGDEAGAR